MILLDRGRVDTFQLALRKNAQQIPTQIEGRVDIPVFVESLVDELPLKIVRETQAELVTRRERLLTDHGDEVTEASSLCVRVVELVCDLALILSCSTFADSFLHQSREGGCRVNR